MADESACNRDIPYLQQLQTNTIRVYAVDPTQNHDACMSAFDAAGIYVIADLSAPVPDASINRDSPAWDDALYTRFTSVVDVMSKYSNTLGFFAGNEVTNNATNTDAIAFVKAAVRDTKAYIKEQNYRPMGVGYATDDDPSVLMDIADYLNCGDAATSIDFLGYNIYSWCGDSTYQASNYEEHTKAFSTYDVPVFFAEYGCNKVEPRTWGDTAALLGPQMTPVWSGGIVYMYFQESNDYGLVTISGNTVTPNQDFKNLASVIAKVSPTGVSMSSYSPSNSAQSCPSVNSDWVAQSSPLPPSPNEQLCDCMYNSLSCVVSSSTSSNAYGELFGAVCGLNGGSACAGIVHNSTSGDYGAYGMCNSTQQLAFAFNQYYLSQNSAGTACDFSGNATTQSGVTPSGTCASLVNQAGTAGTGTVTSSPTSKPNSSGSGSGSSGSGSSSASKGAASINSVPSVESGLLPMAGVLMLALLSGVGMIAL